MNLTSLLPVRLSKRQRRRMVKSTIIAAVLGLALVVSVVSFAVAQPNFPDVPATHPYYAAINALAGAGIIEGFTNGTFGPSNVIMRQQFAKMVVLAGGYPVSESDVVTFTDVMVSGPSSLYPDNYIAVAAARGITLGKTATSFDPYASITRYQVITMVVRMGDNLHPGMLLPAPSGYLGSTGWGNDPQHGANAARAEYNGLLAGLNLTVSPYAPMTRGEVAQVLYNLIVKMTPPSTTTTTGASTTTTGGSTTTTGGSTTTTGASTTTTAASTTTTGQSTTTSLPPTTTTTVPVQYAVAGLENAQVVITVRDQFGNPLPGIDVYLSSDILEGTGLDDLDNVFAGESDANGNVAYSWSQDPGSWGVELVTATIGGGPPSGFTKDVAVVQWIYDDRGTDWVMATGGQQKIEVDAGLAAWNGNTLRAYLAVGQPQIGQGTYVSSVGLNLSTTHTFFTGQTFYVRADSTNTDNEINWMYNIAQ